MAYQEFVALVLGNEVLNESTSEPWDMRHGTRHGARRNRWCALRKEED
jgi:hypothetical protein